ANSILNVAHVDLLRLPPALFQSEPDLGSSTPQTAVDAWLGQLTQLLRARSVDYDLADTHLPPERLGAYDVVFVQSGDAMHPENQAALARFVEAGGRLVVGPTAPTLDHYLRPSQVLNVSPASVADLPNVLDELPRAAYVSTNPTVEVVPHTD